MTPEGLALLKCFEGFRSKRYLDSAGLATIGYGHKLQPGESYTLLTLEQAEALLEKDVAEVEKGLKGLLGDASSTACQREALTSFAFNLGLGALRTSTLLRLLKASAPRAAAWEFEKWCHRSDPKTGQKVEDAGLLRRRLAEQAWFLGGSEALVRKVWEGR